MAGGGKSKAGNRGALTGLAGCAGVLALILLALKPGGSLAQSGTVVRHIVSEDFSRQKPAPRLPTPAPAGFVRNWDAPTLPERVRSEAWLELSNGRVTRSVAITRSLAGTELQRTIQTQTDTWVYYPQANLTIRLSRTSTPAPQAPQQSGRSARREPVPAGLVEAQRQAQRASGYLADLKPTEIRVEEASNIQPGVVHRITRLAIDAAGLSMQVEENTITLQEDLPVAGFPDSFWTFSPPAASDVQDYRAGRQ